MANPDAVMRAAQAGPKPMMGGEMPMGGMPGGEAGGMPMGAPPAAPGGGGLEGMVEALKGVGEFLQSKGPEAQAAMGHFQALLQSMAQIGGGEAPQGMPPAEEPKESGRVDMGKLPGTQVL